MNNKPDVTIDKSADELVSSNKLNIPETRLRTSLEVPGRVLASGRSYDVGSSFSINKAMQTLTISRPLSKYSVKNNKEHSSYRRAETLMTINKEVAEDDAPFKSQPVTELYDSKIMQQMNDNVNKVKETKIDVKKKRVYKDKFEDIIAHADYTNYMKNELKKVTEANQCGVYNRMLKTEKWKKHLVVLPIVVADPLDVANEAKPPPKTYTEYLSRNRKEKYRRDQFIAYLPCKEMPYGFFSSEKTPYPYNSKRNLFGSNSSSEFPVIDVSNMGDSDTDNSDVGNSISKQSLNNH